MEAKERKIEEEKRMMKYHSVGVFHLNSSFKMLFRVQIYGGKGQKGVVLRKATTSRVRWESCKALGFNANA